MSDEPEADSAESERETVQLDKLVPTQLIPPPPPAPAVAARGVSRGLLVALISCVAALVVVVIVVAVILTRAPGPVPPVDAQGDPTTSRTPTEPPVAAEDEARPSTTTLPQLPIQKVRVDTGGTGDLPGVQVFADAIAVSPLSSLVKYCWTMAPDTIADRYATDQARGAILEAFTHPGQIGQTGGSWRGDLVTVQFTNEELYSGYSCPVVTINGEPDRYDRIDAEYLITRMAGRITGSPVNAGDTESKYYIECSQDPLFPWTLNGGQIPIEVDRAPVDAAVGAIAGQRLSVEQVGSDSSARYWKLTPVGASGPSVIVQTWTIRACIGAAG